MNPASNPIHDIVLIGGGHTHALVLKSWAMSPVDGARLTLIDPHPVAPYTGMLPGFIAGHYRRDELDIDLVQLARAAGARWVRARATGIDPAEGLVRVTGRPDIGFDTLSVDIGVSTGLPDIPGFAEHAVGAKPMQDFARAWEGFCADIRAGKAAPDAVVIGGGIAGAEVALAMAHALNQPDAPAPRVTILEAARALAALPGKSRAALTGELNRAGINVIEHAEIASVTADAVTLTDGRRIPAGLTVGAAGARPWDWLTETTLPLTNGFLTVGPTLQVAGHPNVFAAGDCAHLSHDPRPKAGVYAVRAAPVLAQNLAARITGGRLRSFRPQRDYLKLVSLGAKRALGEKNGLCLRGPRIWRLKDRIDRKFMQGFATLPKMDDTQMLCGGCGAKVDAGILARATARLGRTTHPDITAGIGDDAAILSVGDMRQVITTDHLRPFTADPYLHARIAMIHALGDIWAMGAEPQAALVSVTLQEAAPQLQGRMLNEVMAGLGDALAPTGAEIAGGHTSLGPETQIGITLTGLVAQTPVTMSGARPGDALILTKPIGSGTIMAAEMQHCAQGGDVAAAYDVMLQPSMQAAAILAHAHAMTDVTGFGLAGHLANILTASSCGARLNMAAIPVLPGARELARAGIRSTLYPANRARFDDIALPEDDIAPLLFDPQTAGGLLAAVDDGQARTCRDALIGAGYDTAIIGRLVAGPPEIGFEPAPA